MIIKIKFLRYKKFLSSGSFPLLFLMKSYVDSVQKAPHSFCSQAFVLSHSYII